jgi:hypothetical protein
MEEIAFIGTVGVFRFFGWTHWTPTPARGLAAKSLFSAATPLLADRKLDFEQKRQLQK